MLDDIEKIQNNSSKKLSTIIYAAAILIALRYGFFIAFGFSESQLSGRLPFLLWLISVFDLYIHEAGHLFFGFFGKVITALGGSLFQILVPLAAVFVFLKSGKKTLLATCFWLGQNFAEVSVYMADAPYRKLRLINPNLTHDWFYISMRLSIMDSIEDIALIVHIIGVLIIAIGISYAINEVIKDARLYWFNR